MLSGFVCEKAWVEREFLSLPTYFLSPSHFPLSFPPSLFPSFPSFIPPSLPSSLPSYFFSLTFLAAFQPSCLPLSSLSLLSLPFSYLLTLLLP